MAQLMTKIIYGISAIDPVTFVGVAIARTSGNTEVSRREGEVFVRNAPK